VAGLAIIAAGDVIGTLAHRSKGVMAADTIAADVRMGEVGRPTAGTVATLTVVTAGNVQRAFAGGHRAVMTTGATPFDVIVINFAAHTPREEVMARFTIIAATDVPF